MIDIIYAVIFGLLWIVNLVTGTGLDSVYNITGKAKLITLALMALKVVFEATHSNGCVDKKDAFAFGGMFFLFLASKFINGYSPIAVVDYLWIFCLIYLLSNISVSDRTMFYVSIAYGIGGLFILYIYNNTTVLSGWNKNSIAMLGMHSFLVFLIAFFELRSIKQKIFICIIGFVFGTLLEITDSRSGMLFLIVAVLFAINIVPRNFVYGKRSRIVLLLLMPLLVVIVVVMISKTGAFAPLNQWSYMQFKKPVFNGREGLWESGLKMLGSRPLLGVGSAATANWHNSAIACLVGYGVLGYICWISSFKQMLFKGMMYLEDSCVQGCIISFIVLYLQQAVELGFINENPIVLPYVILGIMFGRMKYLRIMDEQCYVQNQYYSSGL